MICDIQLDSPLWFITLGIRIKDPKDKSDILCPVRDEGSIQKHQLDVSLHQTPLDDTMAKSLTINQTQRHQQRPRSNALLNDNNAIDDTMKYDPCRKATEREDHSPLVQHSVAQVSHLPSDLACALEL